MKVLAIGLLVIISIVNGDVTASANELRYHPPENIILADCDENAMQICRQHGIIVVISARAAPAPPQTPVGLVA